MDVEERFIEGKYGDPLQCEDALLFTSGFAAVIDGCTSKSGILWDGRTPGRIAMECVVRELSSMPHDTSVEQALLRLSDALHRWYEEHGVLEEVEADPGLRAGACAAIYSAHHRQLWMIGDCQALVDGKLVCFPTPIESAMTELRAFLIDAELAEGRSVGDLRRHDRARDLLMPLLRRQHLVVNSEESAHGYSLVTGFPIPPSLVHCVSVPPEARSLVLASDGYPRLMSTLEESERHLEDVLRQDPLLYRSFRSTKGFVEGNCSYDDRCYLRISL